MNTTTENNISVLIGGTFNPYTNAYKEMAVSARRLLPSADIIYIPSNLKFIAGWKELPHNKVFSGYNRIELISESIKDINNCYVSDIESTGKVSGRTYVTIQYFQRGKHYSFYKGRNHKRL